jgi:hypothetical protein
MRRRLETRSHTHTAAREKRDTVGIPVPADRLRDVSGFLVLGEETDERASELAVERREDEREGGLRHPRVRRKVVGEREEALARGEGVHEACKG